MLEDFRVPRRGYGRRRWRTHVLDTLLEWFGDNVIVEGAIICVEANALEQEGRTVNTWAVAERRLKLGAIFGQIVDAYGIDVEQTQINQAMMEEARRRSPVEADVIGFFRSNYAAMASVQASIIERHVMDLIMEKAGRDGNCR